MNMIQIDRYSGKTASQILAVAMSHHAANELELAEHAYLAVVANDYRAIDILPLLAGIATTLGAVDVAIDRWTALLELQPGNVFGWMEKGALLHRCCKWSEAIACLQAAERITPKNPTLLLNLGIALVDAGRGEEALSVLRRLQELTPGNPLVEHQIRRIASSLVPFWHIPMLNDTRRNEAFEKAIVQAVGAVGSGALVLDIGAGSGLLSMMAVRAGADNAVCCESVAVVADAAKKIVALNGYDDRISVVAKNSKDLTVGEDINRRADILISEILSSDLLAEGVLSTFEDAIERLVHQDATIIPRAIAARGCLIESDVLAKSAFVGHVSGFDVSPFAGFASLRLPVHGTETPWRRLSDDHDLIQIDLTAQRNEGRHDVLTIPVTADGIAVGVMQWIHVDVADGITFANPPEEYSDGGWLQVVHTFSRPMSVRAGDAFQLRVGHDRTSLIFTPVV